MGAALKGGDLPPESAPEVAFAGRSNVGKSSLINTLAGSHIARISADPGRTRTLNFYEVAAGTLTLVDLPGYGYAKVSRSMRRLWQPAVESYLAERASLRGVVVVVDVRRGLQDEEDDLLTWIYHHELPFCVVLTKADKLKGNERRKQVAAVAAGLPSTPIVFSSRTGEGKDLLWGLIRQMALGGEGTGKG